MSRLSIFPDHGDGSGDALPLPKLVCNDPASIQVELADRGIGFEQWPAAHALPPDADESTILASCASEVSRVQRDGGYQTVDAIRMTPDHPESGRLCATNSCRNTPTPKTRCAFSWKARGCSCCTSTRRCW